jgi:hypothetical protein
MDKYDELIKRSLESETIRELYDNYIIKDITFKEWVEGNIDDLYINRPAKRRSKWL